MVKRKEKMYMYNRIIITIMSRYSTILNKVPTVLRYNINVTFETFFTVIF